MKVWLSNLKTRMTMNAKIQVFVICVEAIIYLLLHNLHDHDCTFKRLNQTAHILHNTNDLNIFLVV